MRAKRSKKYRKIMATYAMTFSFHEPYQVLLDSAFLRACHAFHMPLQKSLENTLQGKCRIFVTKCSLSKVLDDWQRQRLKDGGGEDKRNEHRTGSAGARPDWLPPPTEVPLRHCSHNAEGTPIRESDCLMDLLSGGISGNQQPKNKHHFILATADLPETEVRGRGHVDLREKARAVPGVPIVYVKRSVMVLEELSGVSEMLRRGGEREKMREGLVGGRKRKRTEDDEREGNDGPAEVARLEDEVASASGMVMVKKRVAKKVKGPNPLSVRKKKPKPTAQRGEGVDGDGGGENDVGEDDGSTNAFKAKRKRKHHGKTGDSNSTGIVATMKTTEAGHGLSSPPSRLEVLA